MEFYENYLTTNKDMSKVYWHKTGQPPHIKKNKGTDIEYKLNSSKLRSDEFVQHTTGKHILFGGCSISIGMGVSLEETWPFRLYSDIGYQTGFFNVSLPGGSIIEIINNVFKYIYKYGNPDQIFILLPGIDRDDRYIKKKYIHKVIYNQYLSLELYCKANNIKLFTSSWAAKDMYEILLDFDTFFEIEDDWSEDLQGDIVAKDGSHPGPAVHYFWYNHFKGLVEQ